MDTIHLEVRKATNEDSGGQHSEVAIFINDRDLIDILREIEMPFAIREGHTDIAGDYAGLPPEAVFLPSRYLLGESYDGSYVDKVTVLECTCGNPDCWPFLVRITVQDDRIIWSDFEQPHRARRDVFSRWSYDQLKPFVFDRAQYEAELDVDRNGF